MKVFKISVSIVLGVGLLWGIVFVVSLNNRVKKLDSLYNELKTTVEERIKHSSGLKMPMSDSQQHHSDSAYPATTPPPSDTYEVRNLILNNLRNIAVDGKNVIDIVTEAKQIVNDHINDSRLDGSAKAWYTQNILNANSPEEMAACRGTIVRIVKRNWNPFNR